MRPRLRALELSGLALVATTWITVPSCGVGVTRQLGSHGSKNDGASEAGSTEHAPDQATEGLADAGDHVGSEPSTDGGDAGDDRVDAPGDDAVDDAAGVDGGDAGDAEDPDTADAGDGDAGDAQDAGATDVGGGDSGDAPTDGHEGVDGGAGCHWSNPFGTPTRVLGLTPIGLTGRASFSPDERVAYFSAYTEAITDIFVAVRPDRSGTFSSPTPFSVVNGAAVEESPSITSDGLALFFESDRAYGYRIYRSRRAFLGAEFSPPTMLAELGPFPAGGPYIMPGGDVLYFHALMGESMDIYRAASNGLGFDPPERVPVVSSDRDEFFPVVTPDELTIYFNGPDDPGGPPRIWMSVRASRELPFEPPVTLPELDLADSVYVSPTWISPDGCRLYFVQLDTMYQHWIYVAERPLLP